MNGRLLAVSEDGYNRWDGLLEELRAAGWTTPRAWVPQAPAIELIGKLRAFRPTPRNWRRNYGRLRERWGRRPWTFRYRSWSARRAIGREIGAADLVLQAGATYSHAEMPEPRVPYAVFCDCTVRLGAMDALAGLSLGSERSARRYYALEGDVYRKAMAVFPTSLWVARSLVEHYGVDPSRIVPVSYGSKVRSSGGTPSYDAQTILFVGYEFERKGGRLLLQAFREVVRELPRARLLIAGPSVLNEEVPPGVTFLGSLPSSALSPVYAQASLFAMPSLFEPFGITFLEAMEHGLPCIGTDRCAMPEIIHDGETGLLVAPGDAGDLARKIVRLLANPELMRQMGQRGRERARQGNTWQAVARVVDERLRRLLSERVVPAGTPADRPSREPGSSRP